MDRLFVDTSAWYAFFNRKDPAHQNVGQALEAWAGRLLFTDTKQVAPALEKAERVAKMITGLQENIRQRQRCFARC